VKGGPAERAGLREGDEIVTLQLGARTPAEQVSVTVARGEQNKTFKYRPEGKHGRGSGFDRKKDVADEACTQ
jgi:hypothetical protein